MRAKPMNSTSVGEEGGDHAPQYRKPSVFLRPVVNATRNKRCVTERTTLQVLLQFDRSRQSVLPAQRHARPGVERVAKKAANSSIAFSPSQNQFPPPPIQKTARALIKGQWSFRQETTHIAALRALPATTARHYSIFSRSYGRLHSFTSRIGLYRRDDCVLDRDINQLLKALFVSRRNDIYIA